MPAGFTALSERQVAPALGHAADLRIEKQAPATASVDAVGGNYINRSTLAVRWSSLRSGR